MTDMVVHWADVSRGHYGASLHCLLRHVEQRVVTLADFVATGGIIRHMPTVVYLIYQVRSSAISWKVTVRRFYFASLAYATDVLMIIQLLV